MWNNLSVDTQLMAKLVCDSKERGPRHDGLVDFISTDARMIACPILPALCGVTLLFPMKRQNLSLFPSHLGRPSQPGLTNKMYLKCCCLPSKPGPYGICSFHPHLLECSLLGTSTN